jgi:hypothetical protein
MQTISAADAAQQLGVSLETICVYLRSDRLKGDYAAGWVFSDSLFTYRKSLIHRYDDICRVLTGDGLTERQRDILTRRTQFQKLEVIGAAIDPPITKSRVAAIIKRLLDKG